MARIRTIKPELASSKKLATISRDARLTLVLLITQADDHGFVLGEPRQLLGNLYPHDDDVTQVTLERWLRELVGVGSIVLRHSKHGERVVQVIGWHEHQRIAKPSRSKIEPTLTEEIITAQNFVEKNSTNSRREVEVEVEEGGGRRKKEVEEGITATTSRSVQKPTDRVSPSESRPKPERKYPHFPLDFRERLYERWREKGGVLVEFPRFVREVAVLFDRPEAEWGFTRQEAWDAILAAKEWAIATDRIARNNYETGNLTPGRWAGAFRSTHLPNVRMGVADRDGIVTAFGSLIDRGCAAAGFVS